MKRFLIPLLLVAISSTTWAQSLEDKFEQFKREQNATFDQFVSDKQTEYDAFRKRVNDEYAAFMEKAWSEFKGQPAVQPKPQPKVEPVVYEEKGQIDGEKERKRGRRNEEKKKEEEKQIAVEPEVVVVPQAAPAPEPIAPVQPKEDKQEPRKEKRVSVSFYGTIVSVNFPDPDGFKLASLDEKQLAEAWKQLSEAKYDVTVANVLAIRKSLQLCDWGYLRMLQEVTNKHYGKSNEATFMQAFLMTQSGYQVRLGKDNKKLYLLIASKFDLFDYSYFTIEGKTFYAIDCKGINLYICPAFVAKEQALSLQIAQTQKLNQEPTEKRKLTSKKGLTTSVCVNKNQIDFYDKYPKGYLNKDVNTAWVAYANTPMDPKIKEQLYPTFEKAIANMSQKEAVNLILNWVQTAFVYEYDDKVWGEDRAFFPSETLYYPYCDCEDRSILFSRLVRDLLDLPVVLLYYPGHLATAVAFTEDVQGDYLTYKNKKYVVCDPTFIGAPVGKTMTGMNNETAKIVVL